MISLETLPRDVHGGIAGAWRLVHADPAFTGHIGAFEFRDGLSTSPAWGRRLAFVAVEFGHSVYIEPWGPLPPGTAPEWTALDVSPEQLAALPVCPWRAQPSAQVDAPDMLEAKTIEELRDIAEDLGIEPGNRQQRALVKAIRAAQARQLAA